MHNLCEPALRQAVQNQVDGLLESAMWHIKNKTVSDIESLCDSIFGEPVADTAAIGMTLNEQLAAIEAYADDDCGHLKDVDLSSIRFRIENLACLVIHDLAVSITADIVNVLERVIEDNDLEFEGLSDENPFGWAVHERDREESESCRIYEYRGIESEINVDVWHIRAQARDFYIPYYLERDKGEESIECQNKNTT